MVRGSASSNSPVPPRADVIGIAVGLHANDPNRTLSTGEPTPMILTHRRRAATRPISSRQRHPSRIAPSAVRRSPAFFASVRMPCASSRKPRICPRMLSAWITSPTSRAFNKAMGRWLSWCLISASLCSPVRRAMARKGSWRTRAASISSRSGWRHTVQVLGIPDPHFRQCAFRLLALAPVPRAPA